jgi:hypothetical protein
MTPTHFATISQARAHVKDLLDAAEAGRPATVSRGSRRSALVDANRLRSALAVLRPARAVVVPEADGWTIAIPGLPIAGNAPSLDEAQDDIVDALREYAEDWGTRLHAAPNHADNWGLVQLIELSSDEQLKSWLVGD